MTLNMNLVHLTTAATGPLQALEKKILENQVHIECWFRKAWQEISPPFYCSVDLRNAGFKLAPVDTNLFPGGFNNLETSLIPLCIQATQSTLSHQFPGCEKILLIPENHSSNIGYFENIATIQTILNTAGYETKIGSLLSDLKVSKEIALPSGKKITLHPIIRQKNALTTSDFNPCVILLNHDLSDGIPDLLKEISQPIIPAPELGWAMRLKSDHFTHYEALAEEFAALINIDAWLINPFFKQCGSIDFATGEGLSCLQENTETLLQKINAKYQEYGIAEKPFVAIKADAGTYGMGVMMVQSADEILHLNRKERQKMSVTKGKKPIRQVILQEGVYTFETVGKNQAVAEPVIYMIGSYVVGGFYRVHEGKNAHDNLNAPGSHFHALRFANTCTNPTIPGQEIPNRFYAYGVIARLAALAGAYEDKKARTE